MLPPRESSGLEHISHLLVAVEVSEPGEPCGDLLRLLLNSLYFLANKTYPDDLIKGVFEWRVLAMQGLSPAVRTCCACGKTADTGFALDVAQGELYCGKCRADREQLWHRG